MFWLRVAAIGSVLAFLEWRRQRKHKLAEPAVGPNTIEISPEPDEPIAFGYKSLWLAVRSGSSAEVAGALGLDAVQEANWRTGLEAATRGGLVFVSPPLGSWILVVGDSLPQLGEPGAEEQHQMLMAKLSTRFGEAYFFGTHRVVEYHAWARYAAGKAVRAYAYSGESGEVLTDEGKPSSEEQRAGMIFTERRLEAGEVPDEESVLTIASQWSIDPREVGSLAARPSAGLVGSLRPAAALP